MHRRVEQQSQEQRSASITVRTSTQIAAAIPYLLGFHPQESLVALWMRGGVLVVAQRADLPEEESINDESVDDFVEAYLMPAAGVDADEVLFACFTRHHARGGAIVERALDVAPVLSRGGLLIKGSQVREVTGRDEWRWISTRDRQWAKDNFATKVAPRADREAVVQETAFDEGSLNRVGPMEDSELDVDALAAVIASGEMSVKGIRRLRDSCRSARGRDLVMWWAARSSLAERGVVLDQLLAALRASPTGAHLACAAAVVAWLCGDGVRANACLERCLDEEPQHLMGRMLEGAMNAALAPSSFATMMAEVDPHSLGLEGSRVDEHRGPRYSPA